MLRRWGTLDCGGEDATLPRAKVTKCGEKYALGRAPRPSGLLHFGTS